VSVNNRATFLSGLGAVACLAPRVVGAQEAALTTVRVASVPNDEVSPLLYGVHAGLFRKVGLDVQVQPATSGAAIAAAIIGGAFDIGSVSMMAQITGHVRGVPFVMIAPSLLYLSEDPSTQMLVRNDSPIKSVRDLGGKVIASGAVHDVGWLAARSWADANGVDSSTLKFIELPMASSAAALEAKRIDAVGMINPALAEALATGHFRSIGKSFDGIAKRWLVASYCCTADYAAKNPSVIARFTATLSAATHYANAHHAETAPLIAAFAGFELSHALTMKRSIGGEYLDPRDIQPPIDAAAKYGVIDKGFSAQDVISPYAYKPPGAAR
jgi:NitT/TauT family transport system substrate-binding protein